MSKTHRFSSEEDDFGEQPHPVTRRDRRAIVSENREAARLILSELAPLPPKPKWEPMPNFQIPAKRNLTTAEEFIDHWSWADRARDTRLDLVHALGEQILLETSTHRLH